VISDENNLVDGGSEGMKNSYEKRGNDEKRQNEGKKSQAGECTSYMQCLVFEYPPHSAVGLTLHYAYPPHSALVRVNSFVRLVRVSSFA